MNAPFDQRDRPAAEPAHRRTDGQRPDDGDCHHSNVGRAFCGENLDAGRNQNHRDRIVEPGFSFQRRHDPLACLHLPIADQGQHGCGVSRRHDSPHQQGLHPAKAEQEMGRHCGQSRSQQDAERGQGKRGAQDHAQAPQACAQPPVEQDERERQRPEEIGLVVRVKVDLPGSLHPGQHAKAQEDQQERRPCPARGRSAGNRQQDQARGGQKNEIGIVHRGALWPALPMDRKG